MQKFCRETRKKRSLKNSAVSRLRRLIPINPPKQKIPAPLAPQTKNPRTATDTYRCICMYACICMYVYVCMYMYACICMYVYVCICMCVCMCVYVCVYVCMYVY